MARTGRPPTPIEVKRLRGTDRPDRTPPQSATIALRPADGVPPIPIDQGAQGRAFWPKVWTAAQWLSPDIDRPAVEEACRLMDEIEEMRDIIESEGKRLTKPMVTPAGMVVGEEMYAHPLIKEMRNASKQLQSWLSDLGFNPTARARLGLAEVKTQSAFEELQKRRSARA